MSPQRHQTIQTLLLSSAVAIVAGLGSWQLKTTNDIGGQVIRLVVELEATKGQTNNRYASIDANRDWTRQIQIDGDQNKETQRLATIVSEMRRSVAAIEAVMAIRKP